MSIKMTKFQEKAATHENGPAIVIAGPGSGKTRVMIERIKYLITQKQIAPERIAVTTFTEKATGELKNRLAGELGDRASLVHVSTIHSLCRRFLETVYPHQELGAEFTIMSAEDQLLLISAKRSAWKLIGAKGWRTPLKPYYFSGGAEAAVASLYGLMTTNGISSNQLIDTMEKTGQLTHDLQRVIESYNYYLEYKQKEKVVDFDELLRRVFDILMSNPEAKQTLRDMFDYYLIDEFQDTDVLQDAIFRELLQENRNIFVVGDVNQSIYGFRGASIENFLKFTERYPEAKTYYLMDNFRSTATIVEAANKILEGQVEETLIARRQEGTPLILIRGEDRDESLKNAVDYIQRIGDSGAIESYSDIAILGRTNRIASSVIPFLTMNGIPWISYSDGSFFEQPEVQSFIYFLSYIYHQEIHESKFSEWQSWWNVHEFTGDILGLSKAGQLAIEAFTEDISELNTHEKLIDHGFSFPSDREKLLGLNSLRAETPGKKSDLLAMLFRLFEVTGYLKSIVDTPDYEEVVLNLGQLTELIAAYQDSMSRPGIVGLLNFLHERTRQGRTPRQQIEKENSLKLMTVHRSKGLEFPVVLIPGLTEKGFPLAYKNTKLLGMDIPESMLISPPTENLEALHYAEELRLFYVAITRAQDALILVTSERINTNKVRESRFLSLVKDFVTEEIRTIEPLESHYEKAQRIHQISYSSVNMYDDCPFRYRLVYEAGFRSPALYTQKVGTITHNVLQMINDDMKGRKYIDSNRIYEHIDRYWLNVAKPSETAKMKENLKDRIEAYIEHFQVRYAKVLAAEKPFTFVGNRVIIKGKADLIALTKEGLVELVDFKVTNLQGLEHFKLFEQLNLYAKCLGEFNIQSLAAYAVNDGTFRKYDIDPMHLDKYLERIMKGIREQTYPRNYDSGFHKSGACPFKFLCGENS